MSDPRAALSKQRTDGLKIRPTVNKDAVMPMHKFFILLISPLFMTACGGGDSASSPGSPTADPNQPPAGGPTAETVTGIFVDARVQGLEYETATLSGKTNANGEFQYVEGEQITFTLANKAIRLGTLLGKPILTPADLAEQSGAAYPNAVMVNMMRLLQSLDGNFNPDDGISLREIEPDILAKYYPNGIDPLAFDTTVMEFENSTDLSKLLFEVTTSPALRDLGQSVSHFEDQKQLLAQNGYDDPRGAFPVQQNQLTAAGFFFQPAPPQTRTTVLTRHTLSTLFSAAPLRYDWPAPCTPILTFS